MAFSSGWRMRFRLQAFGDTIAENLPNQPDLNRSGYDGFMQWSDPFHDKMKALLRRHF